MDTEGIERTQIDEKTQTRRIVSGRTEGRPEARWEDLTTSRREKHTLIIQRKTPERKPRKDRSKT